MRLKPICWVVKILLLASLVVSCQENDGFISVQTEAPVIVSAKNAQFVGRLISDRNVNSTPFKLNDQFVELSDHSIEALELVLDSYRLKQKSNFPGIFLGNNLGLFEDGQSYWLVRSTDQFTLAEGNMEFWKFEPEGF